MNKNPASGSLLWEALPDLALNIAQTAALCGVSVRQIGYWTRQGYVAASGQGARRTYGVESIHRVLAIRKAMEAGASLRQSLRQLPDAALSALAPPEPLDAASPLVSASSLVSTSLVSAVSQSLAKFFAVNTHTRDHAADLAVKVGWAENDVRLAADSLCASGLLSYSVCQGMTVFHPAEKEATRV